MSDPKERIKQLVSELLEYNRKYYIDDDPVVSDKEYDNLYKELTGLEEKYPEYALENSPTKQVGAYNDSGNVVHAVQMLSLENSYNRDDVEKFLEKVKDAANGATFVVEPKMDGAAVSITYRNGRLELAATRGDGIVGEDITENVRTIKSLPEKIEFKGVLLVRGEIFMPKEQFERLNRERSEKGLPLFANPRNAAAGSLKLLDQKEAANRGLDIYIYNVDSGTGREKHIDDLEYIRSLDFPVNSLNELCHDPECVFNRLDVIERNRFTLPYDIDGAVIKVNEYDIRNEMGSTGKFPKWAIAYKYEAVQATTVLKDVTFQVGRMGTVTPVAELEPVLLSGSIISRATLHNEDEITRLGVKIGDTVFIEKGGEIIPKVVKVVAEKRPADAKDIIFPQNCPVCGSKLVKPDGEVRWRCVNLNCKARIKGMLIHFASRDAMYIEGLGEVLVGALVDEGRLKTFSDIYSLTEKELETRERMGKKSAFNIIAAIEKSKSQEFPKVLFGLGLPQVGISTARVLAKHYKTIDNLMKADYESLTAVKDIGAKTAEILLYIMKDPLFLKIVEDLKKTGLKFEDEDSDIQVKEKIKDKSFLITGTLSEPRKTVEDRIISYGGSIAGSVSKNLDYLIVGEKAGSKLDKAKKLGIAILTEEGLKELLK